MMCEKLRALLDDKPSFIGRLALYLHLRSCPRCRISAAERRALGSQIAHFGNEPVPPGLRGRVHAAALAAAAEARARSSSPAHIQPRRQEVLTMRRAVMAVVFVGVVVAAVIWQLPSRNSNVALADVARAMAQVKSAHFEVLGLGGERVAEVWVKGPDKCLVRQEGRFGGVDDGERTVSLETRGGTQLLAIVQPARKLQGLAELGEGMTYLDLLSGPGLANRVLETGGAKVISTDDVTLSDGRAAVNMTLAVPTPSDPTPETMVITVDPETNLLIGWKELVTWEAPDEGHGGLRVDRIDYNVDVPDSLFSMDIPKDAVFVDLLTPPSDGLTPRGQALSREARSNGGDVILQGGPDHSSGGSCGSAYHTKLRFQFLDRNATEIYYLPQRNTYYIAGRVLASMGGDSGSCQVLEDQRFQAPTAPDSTPEWQRAEVESALAISAETIAKRDVKEKELVAAGAVLVDKADGSWATCGTHHRGMFIRSLDKSGFRMYYFPSRNTYYVIGKALVWCADWRKTVEDAEIEAPGPPDRTDEQ